MRKRFFFNWGLFFGLLQAGSLQAQELVLGEEPALAQEEQIISPAQTYSATVQSQMEIEVFNMINQNRVANFLPLLTWSNVAAEQARTHSLNMANKIVPFSHEGASARFAALVQAIPSLTRFGENVAYNFGYANPAATAVAGWLKSPGHYANIMGDFNLTGVGVARNQRGEYYFTQIFVKASQTTTLQDKARKRLHRQAYKSVCEMPMLIENNMP